MGNSIYDKKEKQTLFAGDINLLNQIAYQQMMISQAIYQDDYYLRIRALKAMFFLIVTEFKKVEKKDEVRSNIKKVEADLNKYYNIKNDKHNPFRGKYRLSQETLDMLDNIQENLEETLDTSGLKKKLVEQGDGFLTK